MNYSLSQLQAFVATMDEGSFKMAALSLNKRPQVVAKLVATLEDVTNVQLFEREVRQLIPTQHGKMLYRYAKRLVQDSEIFEGQLKSLDQTTPSEFKVAIDSSIANPALTACYLEVLKQFPTIELEVMTGGTSQVLEWLRTGQAELAVVFSPMLELKGFNQVDVFNFAVAEVAAPNLVRHGSIMDKSELADLSQIVPRFIYEFGHQDLYVASPRQIICNNMIESIQMMRAGVGWCRIPRYLAEPLIKRGELHEFSMSGTTQILWYACAVYPENKELTWAGDVFLEQAMKLEDYL
jgi:DNA-binding transcriptional LysR family regulator